MKLFARILTGSIGALAYLAAAQTASAERIYYLVGVRHVYRIGTDKYFNAPQRQQIEVDYANEVSADNAHYQYQITHGGDPNVESGNLQSALRDLSNERETRLDALYPLADDVRANHPAFNIQVDGPYQVIGVNYHEYANTEVWDSYSAYAPWPGYVSVGPNPYGWNYGAVYSPSLFIGAYRGWYGGWVGFGSPAFVGFYGSGGPMVVAGLSVNVGLGFGLGIGFGGFYANAGLGGFYHSGPGYFNNDPYRGGGYITNRSDARFAGAAAAGYRAGAYAVRSARAGGYAAGISAGAHSSFSASARGGVSARAGGGYATSAARTTASRAGAGGGYAHSAIGARSRTGTAARSGGGSRYSNGGTSSRPGRMRTSGSSARTNSSTRSTTPARSSGGNRSGGNFGGYNHGSSNRSSGGGGNRGGGGARAGGGNRGGGGGGGNKRGRG